VSNKTTYFGVRISRDDYDLIVKIVGYRKEDMSSFIRRAIRRELARLSYLSDAEKKALGVKS